MSWADSVKYSNLVDDVAQMVVINAVQLIARQSLITNRIQAESGSYDGGRKKKMEHHCQGEQYRNIRIPGKLEFTDCNGSFLGVSGEHFDRNAATL